MISDEYKKMVLALPDEFFEDWQWKEGDSFLYRPSKDDDWELYYVGSFGTMVKDGIIVFATLIEDATPSQGEYRPVPNQEQLQAMIINNFKVSGLLIEENRYNIYLEWRFEAWLRDQIFEEKAGLSLGCLWLEFLEYAIYGKKWNNEEWI